MRLLLLGVQLSFKGGRGWGDLGWDVLGFTSLVEVGKWVGF